MTTHATGGGGCGHPRVRIVAIGGGTGLPVVLRGLRAELFPNGADDADRLIGVVTVTDEGGSSGRLRDELGMLAPGDLRNCLVALSHNEPLMARLFQARYSNGATLSGHSVGNLILAALAQEEQGNFLAAVRLASEVLNIQGRVLPATLVPTRLVARLEDGREVVGETAITAAKGCVRRLTLAPAAPPPAPGVVDAIRRADVVVLGPGSIYSSVIPHLLLSDVASALRAAPAFRVLVLNAMTEMGETSNCTAADHARAVLDHGGGPILDAVLVATDDIPGDTLARYEAEGAARVDPNNNNLPRLVPQVIRAELLQVAPVVRHDPIRTARAVLTAFDAWRQGPAATPRGRALASQE